jgi:hypothetical protein
MDSLASLSGMTFSCPLSAKGSPNYDSTFSLNLTSSGKSLLNPASPCVKKEELHEGVGRE